MLEIDQRPIVTGGTHELGRDLRTEGEPTAKCRLALEDPLPELCGRRIMCVEHREIVISTGRFRQDKGGFRRICEWQHRGPVLLPSSFSPWLQLGVSDARRSIDRIPGR